MAVDVGMQTAVGIVVEPLSLGVLLPGEALWLPALRAEVGHLCMRPALPPPLDRSGLARLARGGPADEAAMSHSESYLMPGMEGGGARSASTAGSPGPLLLRRHQALPPLPPRGSRLLFSSTTHSSPGPSEAGPPRLQLPPHLRLAEQAQQEEGGASRRTLGHGGGGGGGGGSGGAGAPLYQWSSTVQLQQLLHQSAEAGRAGGDRQRALRHLECQHTLGALPTVSFCMGTSAGAAGAGTWDLVIAAPLVVHSALPMPVEVAISSWTGVHRMRLQPNRRVQLHHLEAAHAEAISLRALGYQESEQVGGSCVRVRVRVRVRVCRGGEGGG
jgi:hypothetical protein